MTIDDLLAGYLETGTVDGAALAELSADDQADLRASTARLDRVRATLADGDTWVEPDPDLEGRVLRAVAAEGSAHATSDEAAPTLIQPVSLADARQRRARLVSIGASIIAAAAIVVAIVAFTTRPSAAPPRSNGTEFALVSTELLAGASGTVSLRETDSGVRIFLDATGLPRRENGQFYEAWAKTDRGLVAIGTFHTGTDVVLWSGVSIEEIDAISVTLEADDGDVGSSGQRVLVAELR